MYYNINENYDFFSKIIEKQESLQNNENLRYLPSYIRDFVPRGLEKNKGDFQYDLYLPINAEEVQLFDNRDLWLNLDMDSETVKYHLKLMKALMIIDWNELYNRLPDIAKDPNKLKSEHLALDNMKQLRKKIFKHRKDFAPEIVYEALKELELLPIEHIKQLQPTDTIKVRFFTLLHQQILNFIDDSTTLKKFGFTIINERLEDGKVIPWYVPVILCVHKPSDFCIMVNIKNIGIDYKDPNLIDSDSIRPKVRTGFALDVAQSKMLDMYNFVPHRTALKRLLDVILQEEDFNNIVKDIHTSQNCLPPSFLELKDTNEFQYLINTLKKIK